MKNQSIKETVFITGAGGFVGRSFIEYLLQSGDYKIVAIEVDPKKYDVLLKMGLNCYLGSTTDLSLLKKIFQDNEIHHVYHTAAIVEEHGNISDFYHINVKATIELAKLSIQYNVKSFIHLSSVMVYGFDYPFMVKEEKWQDLKETVLKTKNPYCVTKIQGEEELYELYKNDKNFNLIILRPGDIIGIHSVPWIIRPIFLAKKYLFAYPNYGVGILNLLYIQNLNELVYQIIKRMPDDSIKGQSYNIRDEFITVREFYRYLFKNLKILPFGLEPLSLNQNLMKFLLFLLYYFQKMFGVKPWVHPDGVNFLLRNNPVDNEKSLKQLNYRSKVTFYEAMHAIIEYYKNQSS
jgi:nucleoside-diphosphate-sugar epimerase